MSAFHLWRRRTTRTKHLRPTAMIDYEKAVARCLGWGGGVGAGGWRSLLLLVALVASMAALYASFSSTLRVSAWFLVPPPSNSSPEEFVLLPSPPPTQCHTRPPLGRPPASTPPPTEVPVSTASSSLIAPSPSPAEGAYDPKTPPLVPDGPGFTPSPGFLPVSTVTPPSVAPLPPPRVGDDAMVNPTNADAFCLYYSEVGMESETESLTDLQLIHAKKEIAGAPVVLHDPDLYAPLFRNVSVFKKSYKMMESILKVYIYEDGPKPLCHTPHLDGIYASEGWFMKLMEENTRFVVKDPNKAHLFYLPYSSRQLRTHLYVAGSRSMQPLSIFLRDYVNSISAKYPFWNRTRGADHFLVACHDWATYTTNLHEDLRKNTIKVVCNADVSEGVFVRGKDVSLAETYVRTPNSPRKAIGGRPASRRSILAFFAGQMHGRVRPILLRHWRGRDRDMKIYEVLPDEIAAKMSYIEHMKSSKFCICPMGYEVNSPRIVEAIYYDCIPVIIANNFVLPFEEVLDWGAFSVVVAEKDIPKLKQILLGISGRRYVRMQTNVRRLRKHFLWNDKPVKYDLFHMILHSIWFNRLNHYSL
ncbi:probable glycosyltransferase At5g25310 [Musa acuminata AAA Group]|uniref:probable glycosyltransferase At5g25310 n=1 Tax=Musa acuminata AAA Group TaxID=214697 RepID=UPI0031E07D01